MELDPEAVAIGLSAESMERRALALIGRVYNDGGEMRVCEHSTRPLPYGCWDDASRWPYAFYGAELWCDGCIAYAALNSTLPRPTQTIEGVVTKKLGPA